MRSCVLALVLCLSSPAWADEAPTHRADLIAWSSDGSSALIKEIITQPDGSGERAIRVVSRRASKRFVFSKVADANAEVAQQVKVKTCIQRLKTLTKRLKKHAFEGLNVDMTCADRSQLITVGGAQKALSADTWFSGEGLQLSRGALDMDISDNVLRISSQGATISTWQNTPQPLQIRATMASSGRLLVIFYGWGAGNWRIMKVLASQSGDPGDFKMVRF